MVRWVFVVCFVSCVGIGLANGVDWLFWWWIGESELV
jgi:hypothetical protein